MKIAFSALLFLVGFFSFSQEPKFSDPYFDYVPEEYILFHSRKDPEGRKDYSFPINMPDNTFSSLFGKPEEVQYFGPGQAYFMYYSNQRTDTVAFYSYNFTRNKGIGQGYFCFLKYPGFVKLEEHFLTSHTSFTLDCYELNNETTLEDISRIFPHSYTTALYKLAGDVPSDHWGLSASEFVLYLRTSPLHPKQDPDEFPTPFLALIFRDNKLFRVSYQRTT